MNKLIATVMFGLALGCGTKAQETADSPEATLAAPSASVAMVRAEPAAGVGWLEAPARTLAAPDASAAVSLPLPARVVRVRVKPGDIVKAGAPLIDVVMPELIHAASTVVASSLRLDAYESRQQRILPLVEQGLARAAESAELKAQVALTKADRETARAVLRSASVSDAQTNALISSGGAFTLRAPIDGTVTLVNARIGELREPASGALIELVRDVAPQVEARFSVAPPEGVGFLWIDGARSVPLTLEGLSPEASGVDGSRVGWLHATQAAGPLTAGLVGSVRMQPPDTWVSVPRTALVTDATGSHVLVVIKGEPTPVSVHVEAAGSSQLLVTGVKIGVMLIADATQAPSSIAAPNDERAQ